MKLSIITPRFKETPKQMMPLLASIAGQLGITRDDLEVIIANDNPDDVLDLNVFDILDLNIKQAVLSKNSGSGIARQVGLELSQGEYVMFCDADDTLHSVGVISAFLKEFDEHPETDYMSSQWLEELYNRDDGTIGYVTHDIDNTWLHGKMFRKSMIVDNGISFHPDLRVHEDSYFLSLVADVSANRRQLTCISYVWKWHNESITRHDKGIYLYEDFPTFIKAISWANKLIMERGSDKIEYDVVQFVMYCYFTFMRANWQTEEATPYRLKAIETLKEEMKPFWHIWYNCNHDTLSKIYSEEREKSFKNEMDLYTLPSFINVLTDGKGRAILENG